MTVNFATIVRRAKQMAGFCRPETTLPADLLDRTAGQLASKACLYRRRLIAKHGSDYPALVEPFVQHIRRQCAYRLAQGSDTANITAAMLDLLSHWALAERRPESDFILLLAAWAEADARGAT